MSDPRDQQFEQPNPPQTARGPRLIPGRLGTRAYTLAALRERVEAQFLAEYSLDSPALREATTPAKRLRLILDVTDHLLAVESVRLNDDERAELVRDTYSSLFGYGPLDPYFLDERVTTIALEGVERASVRCGHGDLTGIGRLFEDAAYLARTIARLLSDAGAELHPEQSVVETGLTIDGRRVRLSVVAPPLTPTIHADIRLHPRQAPSLDDLAAADVLSAEAAALLRQIARSGYGFVIAGEVESGKTTLLGALARELPEPPALITAVQRADELALPDEIERRWVQWPTREQVGITFGEQVLAALDTEPRCLLLDEVRADSPEAIAPLLEAEQAPRQIWVVRGAPDHKRLQSALGMLARRASVGQGELLVHALYERLPFVITVARIRGRLQLFSVAEWQSRIDTDYPDYVMLMHYQDGAARRTDKTLARWLDIDAGRSAST